MHADISLFILLTYGVNFCVPKKYYNFTLFRTIPTENIHMEYLKNLTQSYEINFWRRPGIMYKPVEFVVSPADKSAFLNDAYRYGLYLTTITEDIQEEFDKQIVKPYMRSKPDTFDWNNFYRLNDIYEWLQDLAKAYPQEMVLRSIGRTYEDRDIMSVHISLEGNKKRSKVIIEGGIHAREWIAPAFVTYMINEIIHARSSKNAALKRIAVTYEWYFVPVLNPDGYEYSHTEDRLWRKNRNGIYGVDLNRNFQFAFGTIDANENKSSEIHSGPHAFSEKETIAMAAFVRSMSNGLEYYLTFHSYGQFMVIPYSNTKSYLDNFIEVKDMCNQAKQNISSRYKTHYTVGTIHDTVGYLASGTSCCWVKRNFRVPYVVTFELRDEGAYGFALPPWLIMPTCLETMDGVISLLTPRTMLAKKLIPILMEESSGNMIILDEIVIAFVLFLILIVALD